MNLCKGAIWPHRYNDTSKGVLFQESNEKLKYFIQTACTSMPYRNLRRKMPVSSIKNIFPDQIVI